MRHTMIIERAGIKGGESQRLEDLDFVDEICLIFRNIRNVRRGTEKLTEIAMEIEIKNH